MKTCGAKTRSGDPCKNAPMANGRCRMHGGKSTGPPPEKMKGNKNAVVTGERETIWRFSDDERSWLSYVDRDVLIQLDHEIDLVTVRERRMLQRIDELTAGNEMGPVSVDRSRGEDANGQSRHETLHAEAKLERIQRIEEALTRVQNTKIKLLQAKFDVLSRIDKDDEETRGVLRELAQVIEFSKKQRDGEGD
ncbi:HGGxSTG domain-containing protein [Alicyclobacillus fastidiosus]|uniref:HGGxSTG domain-containing protein n=1 Tax=Alicyclobacillus fastidiosus TaxID=392011 RepID=A0ABV5AL97_9BACL|nr:HGGxSTG domain-containing protein [Alicyclobacillus fastidiosus]WEH08491.1 HGGxSTG domain-containing protein [Alicyclobacillus fastidiosus]